MLLLLANSSIRCVRHVVRTFRNTCLSDISQWYIQLWSTQIDNGKLHAQIALKACHSLTDRLSEEQHSSTIRLGTIQSLCEKIHAYLTQLLDFASPLKLAGWCECEYQDGVNIHLPTAVATLNGLVRFCKVCTIVH